MNTLIDLKNEIKQSMEHIIEVLLLEPNELNPADNTRAIKEMTRQNTPFLDKNGLIDSMMKEINAASYMSHNRIQEMLALR